MSDFQHGIFTLINNGSIIKKAKWDHGTYCGLLGSNENELPQPQDDLPGSVIFVDHLSPQKPVEPISQVY